MRKTIVLLVALLAAGAVSLPGLGAEKRSGTELPPPVRAAMDHRFPDALLTAAERETENGNVVYDIELKHQGRKYEMDVKEDGTILEIEKEIKPADIPPAVSKVVEEKYPKSAVKEVMEVNLVSGTTEKPDHYEVTLTPDGGKEKEVVVALDGSSVKEEVPEGSEK